MFYDYNVREQFTKHCMRKCAPSTRQNNGSEINKKVKNGRIKNLMCKKDVDQKSQDERRGNRRNGNGEIIFALTSG